jgi:uncharacterized membrane protein
VRPARLRSARATGIASLVVLGLGLTALFAGLDWFWVIFAVGFAVVVPLVGLLVDRAEPSEASTDRSPVQSSDPDTDAADPLATLRERYARGELTDEQFEQKLETLLETETMEAAEERARRDAGRRPDEPTADTTRDRETE